MTEQQEMRDDVPYLLRCILAELQAIRALMSEPIEKPSEEEVAQMARTSYIAAAKVAQEELIKQAFAMAEATAREVREGAKGVRE